jgi:hypothetical protein
MLVGLPFWKSVPVVPLLLLLLLRLAPSSSASSSAAATTHQEDERNSRGYSAAAAAADIVFDVITSTDQLSAPLGLATVQPRLSWHVASANASFARGTEQASYRVQVAETAAGLLPPTTTAPPHPLTCDTGIVASNVSSLVKLPSGTCKLQAGRIYWWRVHLTFRVTAAVVAAASSSVVVPAAPVWSQPTRFSIAPAAFSAKFIGLRHEPAKPLTGYFINPCIHGGNCPCPVPGYSDKVYNGCTWWVDNSTVPHTRHFVNNCDKNRAGCGPAQLKCWPHFTKGMPQASVGAHTLNAIKAGRNYSCDMNNWPSSSVGFNQSACPWLRKTFTIPTSLRLGSSSSSNSVALVYVGSVGYHELWINGKKATDDVLSPSVSDLAKTILVRTYDVSSLLRPGESNVIGLWLSSGWAGFTSVNPKRVDMFNVSRDVTTAPVAMAELHVLPKIGSEKRAEFSTFVLGTDKTWRASPSDTAHVGLWTNSNYGGDRVDARLSQPGWASPTVSDTQWATAAEYSVPNRKLVPEVLEPNRLRETIPAVAIMPMHSQDAHVQHDSAKAWLVEMEQVYTGFLALNITGQPGDTVTIQASSVPVCGTLPAAKAATAGRPYCAAVPEYNMQHEYVIGASGRGRFMPRFSYHEVHFLVITGLGAKPELSQIMGHRVGNIAKLDGSESPASGRQRLAYFHSTNALLNQIYNVSLWTKANLVTGGMSVDCP